jgi:hypothetical protein
MSDFTVQFVRQKGIDVFESMQLRFICVRVFFWVSYEDIRSYYLECSEVSFCPEMCRQKIALKWHHILLYLPSIFDGRKAFPFFLTYIGRQDYAGIFLILGSWKGINLQVDQILAERGW